MHSGTEVSVLGGFAYSPCGDITDDLGNKMSKDAVEKMNQKEILGNVAIHAHRNQTGDR
jgi:hypothetical protein